MAQSTIVGHENQVLKNAGGASESPRSKRSSKRPRKGLSLERRYTRPEADPFDEMVWERRQSVITNPDGSVVFKMEGAEIPAGWSQLATDIVVSKYFRKAGLHGDKELGETSVRQVVYRIAHTIRERRRAASAATSPRSRTPTRSRPSSRSCWSNQYGAFNSPVWFNCGLFHDYGITGSGGNWAWSERGRHRRSRPTNAYERPQCSACFIQSVDDDLMGIYELVKSEARLFKYGSGTGIELQRHPRQAGEAVRRRHLERPDELPRGVRSRGGRDQERRHHAPRREDGLPRHGPPGDRRLHQLEGARGEEGPGARSRPATPATSTARPTTPSAARTRTTRSASPTSSCAPPQSGGKWQTRARTTGEVVDTLRRQRPLEPGRRGRLGLRRSGRAVRHARSTAGTPARTPGTHQRVATRAPSTCSSTTRPATSSSLNLTKFLRRGRHASTSRATATRAHLLHRAGDPGRFLGLPDRSASRKNSHDYRPLGLGYANLGTLLMLLGIPYDSDKGARSAARSPRSCAATPTRSAPRWPRQGPVRRLRQEPRADAARDAHAPRRRLRHQSRRVPGARSGAPRARTGTRPSRSARSTATATRRPPCSRRPARSAC